MQTSITKWFGQARVEKQALTTSDSELVHEGDPLRASPNTVNEHRDESHRKAKEIWKEVGIASYNVETLGNNRIQTI